MVVRVNSGVVVVGEGVWVGSPPSSVCKTPSAVFFFVSQTVPVPLFFFWSSSLSVHNFGYKVIQLKRSDVKRRQCGRRGWTVHGGREGLHEDAAFSCSMVSFEGRGFFSCVSVFFNFVLSKLVTSEMSGLSLMVAVCRSWT